MEDKPYNVYCFSGSSLRRFFSSELMIIDTKENDILHRLEDKKIKFKVKRQLARPDPQDRYLITFLRVKNKYGAQLLNEVEYFWKYAALLGYKDYYDYCNKIYHKLVEGRNDND